MDICSYCGHELRFQARFCPGCGKEKIRSQFVAIAGIESRLNGASHTNPLTSEDVDSTVSSLLEDLAASIPFPLDTAAMPETRQPEEVVPPVSSIPETAAVPETPLPEEMANPGSSFPETVVAPETLLAEEVVIVPVPPALSLADETANVEDRIQPVTPPEPSILHQEIIDTIDHLFYFLPRDQETQNRQNIENVRQNNIIPGLMGRVSAMCRHICNQIIEDYSAGRTERYLSNKDLELAILLGEYAVSNSSGNQNVNAKKNVCALETLWEMQSGYLTPADLIRRARNRFRQEQPGSPVIEPPWSDVARIVASYLKEQRRANNLVPEVARQWIDEYSDISTIEEGAYRALLDAAQPHYALSFLTKAERVSLFEHMRNVRFEQIGTLLSHKKSALLRALREALADPCFDEVLPPRRSTSIVFRGSELIPEIRRKMETQDQEIQRDALNLLVAANREIVDKEHIPVVREWKLYVSARVLGRNRLIEDWQTALSNETASWEEIWNLAVALHEGPVDQSLRALMPGVTSRQAPLSHLRFALFCAITLIQRPASYPNAAVSEAETFLLNNLTRLPAPLTYLTWLLFAHETPEAVDFKQQLSIINVFQDILDRPITCKRTTHAGREINIEDFEREFAGLLATTQMLERDYVLEPQQGSIKITGKMLETSIRLSYNIPRRVGIFVDYENLILSLPEQMQNQSKLIAKTLVEYAHTYGNVVSCWMSYFPANIRAMPNVNQFIMESAFHEAGFKLKVPLRLTDDPLSRENLSDSVLIECITAAMIESKPDVYIIVSGDHIYYERIRHLLEQGNAVRILSHPQKCSGRYKRLEEDIQNLYLPEEYGKFALDDLEAVFQLSDEDRAALHVEIQARRQRDSLNAEIHGRNNRQ